MQLLKAEDFEPWVGRQVRVNTLPAPVEVKLERIQRHAPLVGIDTREPFSLYFESPINVFLLDTSYQFDCGKGGPHEIHITQLMPSAKLRHYEAVFT